MMDDYKEFKTKLLKDPSSFCIDSLLSSKTPTRRREPTTPSSPPTSSPASSSPTSPPLFPPSSPNGPRVFLPPHLSMLPPSSFPPLPPPGLENIFKQDLFSSQVTIPLSNPKDVQQSTKMLISAELATGAASQVRDALPKLPPLYRSVWVRRYNSTFV